MFFLLLAIASSALISIAMRLSEGKVKGDYPKLVVNYATCASLGGFYILSGGGSFKGGMPSSIIIGAIAGVTFLVSLLAMQMNIRKNGVVLSATFMKLGLLVPMAISLLFFGERPGAIQIAGFIIAILAIILINYEKEGAGAAASKASLIFLLLADGASSSMSKIYGEPGDPLGSDQFLFFTFFSAFLLSLGIMIAKGERIGGKELFYGLLVGVPNYFSARFMLKAIGSIPAVVAYPTFSVATIVVITLFGVFFFKEKLSKRQFIAIGMILAAVALLNI